MKKTMLYVLASLVFILVAISCDGGGGSNGLNSTRQFYSIDDVKTDGLEEILGKSVEFFVNVSDSCKLVVVENIGDFYDIVPIQIEGDPIRQGVYITKLETIENDNPYVSYESCDFLSRSGDMQVMRVPYLRLQENLIEKVIGFPQSETCDGYKNYIGSLSGNTVYISTSSSNNSTTTSNNTTSTQPTTYSWYANAWEACDKGTLTQTRAIYCKSSNGSQVADSYCTEAQTSSTNQSCITIDLKTIEGGTFSMGSDTDTEADNYPAHNVTIAQFYVGQYEVTNNEVVQVYNWAKKNNVSNLVFSTTSVKYDGTEILDLDSSSCKIAYKDGYLYVEDGKENYPCVTITWYGAKAFTEFLNQQENTNKYRLLTEAEWEYAAKGGKSSNTTYSGSDTIDYVAWYSGNADSALHEVGKKTANELGLHDMSGNASEWVYDYYSNNYNASPVTTHRVLRGGSYAQAADSCTVIYRSKNTPSSISMLTGFRIAKSL